MGAWARLLQAFGLDAGLRGAIADLPPLFPIGFPVTNRRATHRCALQNTPQDLRLGPGDEPYLGPPGYIKTVAY